MSAASTVPSRGSREALTPAPRRVQGRLAPEAMFPAGLPGYRTRFEQFASGERIRIVETGPETGRPVLLIHGWGCSIWDFNRTLAPIAAAGFRAIALDLRGHGLSDMPGDDALYSTDALIRFLVEALDVLRLPSAIVIGHSMGGALAVHLALHAPRRVAALVLISAVGLGSALPADVGRVLTPRWSIPLARAALQRAVLAAGLRLVYGSSLHVDARNIDEYWAPSQFAGFVPSTRALLHHFRWSLFTAEELERIHAPCLVVRGGLDRVVRVRKDMARLHAWRELVVPEAGHLPHDESPDGVNDAIVSFLNEQR